jgi:hypothetical protein
MLRTYRRFHELRDNAQHYLTSSYGNIEERLTKAVCEIDLLQEDDIPKHAIQAVLAIIKSCTTHKAQGDEGDFRASINKMNFEEKKSLQRSIESL